jgi:tetratricopeptide (TPR) repeat protein
LEHALDQVRERTDDAALEVRFLTYLACAYSDAGNVERAARLLEEASERAEAVASPQARIRVYWSLARLAWWDAQDSPTALRYAHAAIGLYRTTEDTRGLALAHVLCASLLNLERKWKQAARHLERADAVLTTSGANPAEIGVLRAEQAKVAAWSGNGEEALTLATEAKGLLAEDPQQAGLVTHALAAAYAAAGNMQKAEPLFEGALDFLTKHRQWREATMVAREWATLARSVGQTDKALDLMERASSYSFRERPVRAG